MSERRLTVRLNKYWEKLRGDNYVPNFSKFNGAIIADIWGACVLLEAEPTVRVKKNFKFSYVGDNLTGILGKNLEGKQASKHNISISNFIKIFKKINELENEPIYDSGSFVNDNNKIIKYRSCLLPFGMPKKGLTNIIIGLSWKEF